MANTVKVALIGAGRTGTPLLKELLKHKYIKIVGVADRKEGAAGIKLAATKRIYTTADPMALLKKAGVDLAKPDTVQAIIDQLDDLVTRLEREIAAL